MAVAPTTQGSSPSSAPIDSVSHFIQASSVGGVLDTAALGQALQRAGAGTDLIGAVLRSLPFLDQVRLNQDLGVLGYGPLNLAVDVLPTGVASPLNSVLEATEPLSDPLYESRSEKQQMTWSQSQLEALVGEARRQADLDRVLPAHTREERITADGSYALRASDAGDQPDAEQR